MDKIKYVVGFAFDLTLTNVALIRKNRPEWQMGLLNGIGGHIEKDELPLDAMIREFKEETGVEINDWIPFTEIEYENCIVYFFKCYTHKLPMLRTTTDESIIITEINERSYLNKNVYNIPYLILMALSEKQYLKIKAYEN